MELSDEMAVIVAALRSAMAQRCATCGRPRASDEQWETTTDGERSDLCWEDGPESCPWSGMVDLDEARAAAVLCALRPGIPAGDADA